jgi:O-methyltransferase
MNSVADYFHELLLVAKLELQLLSVLPSALERQRLHRRLRVATRNIECLHDGSHLLQYVIDLLALPSDLPGCIVEAGCFKGGGTAKLSHVARMLNRRLVVFDSFEGLPPNLERHEESILGHSIENWFQTGKFRCSLEEVKSNVERFGDLESCDFIKGWFEATMPTYAGPIVAAYLDVDLAASTRTCLKFLYPRIVPGGILYSQDGDFPLVISVFNDDEFWRREVGCEKPAIEGLGRRKILSIKKPVIAATVEG